MRYLALLARLLYDPLGAITALRATRPIGPALVVAVLATVLYQLALSGFLRDLAGILAVGGDDFGAAMILVRHLSLLPVAAMPLIFLAFIYVPAVLLLLGVFVRASGPVDLLRRDYGASMAAVLSAWSLTLLLWLVPALVFVQPGDPASLLVWTLLPAVFFLIPVTVNFARVADAGYARAIVAVLGAGFSLSLLRIAFMASLLLTSPLVLLVLIFLLRGVFRDWAAGRNARERLHRSLETATLNPADSSAHTNLGLIYLEQGDVARAADHFGKAIAIDPGDVDAHYELGRIAREQGRLSEAIQRFDAVVQTDDAFRNSEVWREIGSTYYAAGQYVDARTAFEQFVDSRPSDAEGLYKLGLTLDALGEPVQARARMNEVIEAVRTAPNYKYRLERRWLLEAESYLRER